MRDAAERLRQFMGELTPPTQEALGKLLRVRQGFVSAWLRRRKRPGLKHAFNIERVTGIKAESWAKVEITRTKGPEGKAA